MKKAQKQDLVYPIQIYITEEVYESLPPSYRDLYHSSIEVAGILSINAFLKMSNVAL